VILQRAHLATKRTATGAVPHQTAVSKRPRLPDVTATPHNILALQRVIGNQATIQRFLGAKGTNLPGEAVPVTLDQEFLDKHVAANSKIAKDKSLKRINDGKALPTMKAGKLANTVATEENWRTAINASADILPPNNAWSPTTGDDSERFHNLGVKVEAWEVTRTDIGAATAKEADVAPPRDVARALGGTWTIDNDIDISADVNHATSRV
jgi:hypothetical protein